jgi:hypothetical protein
MTATEIMLRLKHSGIQLQATGDRLRFYPLERVPNDLRREMADHKADLLTLLSTNPLPEFCTVCVGTVRRDEHQNFYEAKCLVDPLHYSEIKRKPGCNRSWDDITVRFEPDNQQVSLF